MLLVLPWVSGAARSAEVPEWLFPLNPPSSGIEAPYDAITPRRVPGSTVTHTDAQLHDLYSAPGWFPQSHSAMPDIVAHGRRPGVYACGYCHTPGGQGRPENASLAGLPAAYIIQQVADFKTGARRSAGPPGFVPANLMVQVAGQATPPEVVSAAHYFSMQRPIARVRVVETDRVPQSRSVGWVYAAVPGGVDEPLGTRLMEFAPDPARHENRDDGMQYVAYAPVGSIRRGRAIAVLGTSGPACVTCHGQALRGAGAIPPIAGRSASYLLRQLLAFQTGARAGRGSPSMQPVASRLSISDMIDVTAYAASLQP